MTGFVLAIDPGNRLSGFSLIDTKDYRPLQFGKVRNDELRKKLIDYTKDPLIQGNLEVVIEMVAHYGSGMPAGKEVFDTCVYIGHLEEICRIRKTPAKLLERRFTKLNICGQAHAKDSNIIRAICDRFVPGQSNYGKGTKLHQGFFYGFKADIWQSYALGVTYIDMKRRKEI